MHYFQLGDKVNAFAIIERKALDYIKNEYGYTDGQKKEWVRKLLLPGCNGIIIGKRTLSNGINRWGQDYGNVYFPKVSFVGYIAAFDLKRKPIYVRPEDIELIK